MSKVIQKNEALQSIEPLLPLFVQALQDALIKFNAGISAFDSPFSPRTKAMIINNLIITEAKMIFGNANITIIEKYSSIMILIDNKLAGRFKKFNSKHRPSNVSTKRNNCILTQTQLEFEEYPIITYFNIAYIPDVTWTAFEYSKIVCLQNDEELWSFEINGTEGIYITSDSKINKPNSDNNNSKIINE